LDAINAEVNFDVAVPLLQVENLTVRQGSYTAVEQVSFELLTGTDTAIVGPNGAGKSTLVQAILGLIPATTGTVRVFGRPLDRLGKLRHQIGYIPQNFIFERNFPLSVTELVSLGWANKAQAILDLPWKRNPDKTAAIAQALERVGASHLAQRSIGKLSGGELKRILLAYCLVSPRRLLILDEAFAGVDIQGETDFYALLNQLKQEQQWTVLQISHDLDMVSRHCDRVLCLNRSLICHGRPETALSAENLLHAYGPAFSRYEHRH
jgi:zinc transport system ATP-binding protein